MMPQVLDRIAYVNLGCWLALSSQGIVTDLNGAPVNDAHVPLRLGLAQSRRSKLLGVWITCTLTVHGTPHHHMCALKCVKGDNCLNDGRFDNRIR